MFLPVDVALQVEACPLGEPRPALDVEHQVRLPPSPTLLPHTQVGRSAHAKVTLWATTQPPSARSKAAVAQSLYAEIALVVILPSPSSLLLTLEHSTRTVRSFVFLCLACLPSFVLYAPPD